MTLSIASLLSTTAHAGEGHDTLHLSVEDQLKKARVLSTRDDQALSTEFYRLEVLTQLTGIEGSDNLFRLENRNDVLFTQRQLHYRNGETQFKVLRQVSTDKELDLSGLDQNLQSQTQLNLRTDLTKKLWLELQGRKIQLGRQSFTDFIEQRGSGRLVVEVLPRLTGSVGLLLLEQGGNDVRLKTRSMEAGLTYHGDPFYLAINHGNERLFDGQQDQNDSSKSYTVYSVGTNKILDVGLVRLRPSLKFIESRWVSEQNQSREQRTLVSVEAWVGPKTHLILDYGLENAHFSASQSRQFEILVLTLNHNFSKETKLGLTASWEQDRSVRRPAKLAAGLHLRHHF